MAKVRAVAKGYYDGRLRERGDVFEAEGKASWFAPVDSEPKAPKANKPAKLEGGEKKDESLV